MAITISGENNNDRILAQDGVIDQISGINIVGLITASHIDVGSNINLGNAGIITATTFVGNLTGNVNSTSPLLLQTNGGERFRITGNNELGIAGANYGSAGQVLTSGGSGSSVTWSAIPSQVTISNNADNRVITGGSGTNLNGEANLTFDGSTLAVTGAIDANGDLDVDGHTNLDNVSIAGVTTFTGAIDANSTLEVAGIANFDSTLQVAEKIEHLGDTDTYLQFTANTINLHSGGTTGLSVQSDSVRVPTKLGINGAAPQTPIDVIANGSGYAINIRGRSSDNTGELRFTSNNYGSLYGTLKGGATYLNFSVDSISSVLRLNSTGLVTMDNGTAQLCMRDSGVVDNAIFYIGGGTRTQTSTTTDFTQICLYDKNSQYNTNTASGSWKSKIKFFAAQMNGGAREGAFIGQDTTYNNFSGSTIKMRSDLIFGTRGDAQTSSSDPATEKLRIRHDGKVVIGTNYAGGTLSVTGNLITDDGTNGRITLQADGTSTNQILSTTTGFGSYCNMSYQAADHIFRYGGNETFRINADGTFRGKPDQVNGRDTNEVLGGKSFKYTTSNISPSWGSGSNGWYSFYHMSDGVYTFWLHTGAHSSICFTASNGYDPSLKSFITVHHFINNGNGNYGNVKGIRVTNDGIVQVYLHASAANNYFEMYVQVTCGDLTNMPNLYATITKETGSPSINDSWGTADAYSPPQGAHTTDGVCSPRILHNRREMSCFATSTSLYGSNTSGAKGFYWDPDTASVQSAQPRNTGWSSYYINKHDGNGGSENRYIDFWHNGGQVGNITLSGSGVNYGSSSDYRLKKDDVVMTDGISRVKQLRPIKYKWIKDNVDDEGFFAHEAQAVVPVAVEGTKDQVVLQSEVDAGTQPENKSAGEPIYQTMDNSKLVPVLTAALKEAIDKIETLEAKVAALESS